MIELRELRAYFITPHLKKGGTAVDFTMGNGNDTLFLSESVGENGRVYAFDIQEKAVENTEKLLVDNKCAKNYTLIKDSHSNVLNYVTAPICAGVFNLGYLPGSGNKSLTTMHETTLAALKAGISLLDETGIIFVTAYPGHEEGKLEGGLIETYLSSLERKIYCCSTFKIINSKASPYFIIIEKNRKELN